MACCRACEQAAMGGVDGGECDQPFAVTWPSDVDRLKARLKPAAEAIDLGVKSCQALAPEERAAWDLFIRSFRAFANEETSTFGSYGQWITACSYAHSLDAWRDKLSKVCVLPGPDQVAGADTSIVKWIVGGAIVVAAVVALKTVLHR